MCIYYLPYIYILIFTYNLHLFYLVLCYYKQGSTAHLHTSLRGDLCDFPGTIKEE